LTKALFLLPAAAGALFAAFKLIRPSKARFEPVRGFEPRRYLGTWYEIARMPVWFEKGLVNVTATYTLRDEKRIAVLNEGDRLRDGTHTSARGKATFASAPDVAHLRVSFFGPFYADYIIAELDRQSYRYALVVGNSPRTAWILSREPALDHHIVNHLRQTAHRLGIDTSRLYYTPQASRPDV
jgi:apolipoprotein D and lipocalin family protein